MLRRGRYLSLTLTLSSLPVMAAFHCVPPVFAQTTETDVINIGGEDNLKSALNAVQNVRARSHFRSKFASSDLNIRLARLLRWVVQDYQHSAELHLLSAVPEGVNGRGRDTMRLRTLQQTYWLQDNALYGAGALQQYVPSLGRDLESSWRSQWERRFPNLCPLTQSAVVVGKIPKDETNATEARCKLPHPSDWQMQRMYQYPSPSDEGFDQLPRPIIGTDYPADREGQAQLVPIKVDSARDLLKYGCLRQVVLGHRDVARRMFDLALKQWDGSGFVNASKSKEQPGIYWTRDLAFAMLCVNALDLSSADLSSAVHLSDFENRLWQTQSDRGGIQSNYCSSRLADKCDNRNIPPMAKQTNEIAPLVLLAYGRNIWDGSDPE